MRRRESVVVLARPGNEGFNSFAAARLQTHQARVLQAGRQAKTKTKGLSGCFATFRIFWKGSLRIRNSSFGARSWTLRTTHFWPMGFTGKGLLCVKDRNPARCNLTRPKGRAAFAHATKFESMGAAAATCEERLFRHNYSKEQ